MEDLQAAEEGYDSPEEVRPWLKAAPARTSARAAIRAPGPRPAGRQLSPGGCAHARRCSSSRTAAPTRRRAPARPRVCRAVVQRGGHPHRAVSSAAGACKPRPPCAPACFGAMRHAARGKRHAPCAMHPVPCTMRRPPRAARMRSLPVTSAPPWGTRHVGAHAAHHRFHLRREREEGFFDAEVRPPAAAAARRPLSLPLPDARGGGRPPRADACSNCVHPAPALTVTNSWPHPCTFFPTNRATTSCTAATSPWTTRGWRASGCANRGGRGAGGGRRGPGGRGGQRLCRLCGLQRRPQLRAAPVVCCL